jgi:hypothetical protein
MMKHSNGKIMNEINLESLELFHKIFRGFRSFNGCANFFRGQADKDWSLLPKAGRQEYLWEENGDLKRFNIWERQAIAYAELPNNIYEKLAIAQHHGLATRLLDWTQNPLVAAYFAVSTLSNTDGAIYILEPPHNVIVEDKLTIDQLKNYKGVSCYFPRAISPRVINQKGMFTVHCSLSSK